MLSIKSAVKNQKQLARENANECGSNSPRTKNPRAKRELSSEQDHQLKLS